MYEVICPYCDGEGWVKVVEDDDPDRSCTMSAKHAKEESSYMCSQSTGVRLRDQGA